MIDKVRGSRVKFVITLVKSVSQIASKATCALAALPSAGSFNPSGPMENLL